MKDMLRLLVEKETSRIEDHDLRFIIVDGQIDTVKVLAGYVDSPAQAPSRLAENYNVICEH